jgi:hypothetical protein
MEAVGVADMVVGFRGLMGWSTDVVRKDAVEHGRVERPFANVLRQFRERRGIAGDGLGDLMGKTDAEVVGRAHEQGDEPDDKEAKKTFHWVVCGIDEMMGQNSFGIELSAS